MNEIAGVLATCLIAGEHVAVMDDGFSIVFNSKGEEALVHLPGPLRDGLLAVAKAFSPGLNCLFPGVRPKHFGVGFNNKGQMVFVAEFDSESERAAMDKMLQETFPFLPIVTRVV